VVPPIVQSSTFVFADTEALERYWRSEAEDRIGAQGDIYTRYGNPTVREVEERVADLEGAEAALATASGSGAVAVALMTLLEPGATLVSSAGLYGGTRVFQDTFLARRGVRVRRFHPGRPEEARRLLEEGAQVLYLETPVNPTLEVLDIAEMAPWARGCGALTVVDNTFATPVLQRPLGLGADLVVHSASKFLGGHSDLIGGVLAGSRELIRRCRPALRHLGACMDPHTAFLLLRGLKTLVVRVAAQCETAEAVARFLERHPRVRRVLYPGLEGHPGHEIASRQMARPGCVLTFEVEGGLEAARRTMDRFEVILNATSLGGVESLASIPVLSSHHGWTEEALEEAEVTPGMIRLSVGLEEPEDLMEDLAQALEAPA
jgi:cystathionine beta-lyase/cystathionine gamma-synthase